MKFPLMSLVFIVFSINCEPSNAQINHEETSRLMCYVCDGSQSNCDDPFFSVGISAVDCRIMDYDDEENMSKNKNKWIAYKNPTLRDIFKNEKNAHAFNGFYSCMKVKWINSDGSISVDRTCAKLNPSIQDVCELINLERRNAQLKSCHACTTHFCNSVAILRPSMHIFAIIALIVAKFA